MDLANLFLKDLKTAVDELQNESVSTPSSGPAGFHH
jgi:hypothetical protein